MGERMVAAEQQDINPGATAWNLYRNITTGLRTEWALSLKLFFVREQLGQVINTDFVKLVQSKQLELISDTDTLDWDEQYKQRDKILKEVFGSNCLDEFDTQLKSGKNNQKRRRQILTAAVAAAQAGDPLVFGRRLRHHILKGFDQAHQRPIRYTSATISIRPHHLADAIQVIASVNKKPTC